MPLRLCRSRTLRNYAWASSEPAYRDGTYPGDPIPNQGTVATGTWQDWDPRAGGSNPSATLVNQPAGGGLNVVAGFGAGAWNNFVGHVDAAVSASWAFGRQD